MLSALNKINISNAEDKVTMEHKQIIVSGRAFKNKFSSKKMSRIITKVSCNKSLLPNTGTHDILIAGVSALPGPLGCRVFCSAEQLLLRMMCGVGNRLHLHSAFLPFR